MKNNEQVTLWSVQNNIVMDTLREKGRYVVKKEYINHKYKEASKSFIEAYNYIAYYAKEVIAKPEDADYLIWAFRDIKWAKRMGDDVLLRLEVPREDVFFFDLRKWNKILNLSYIGRDEEDEKHFEEELKKMGIVDVTSAFLSSLYPLQKRKIKDSWQRLFADKEIPPTYQEGGLFCLESSWIKEIIT